MGGPGVGGEVGPEALDVLAKSQFCLCAIDREHGLAGGCHYFFEFRADLSGRTLVERYYEGVCAC